MYSSPNFELVCCSMSGSVASLSAYGFLRRQVRWSGIPISKDFPQFVVIYTIKGFSVVSETEVDVFLEFPCPVYDVTIVGSLISGSSDFSESSLLWVGPCASCLGVVLPSRS